ncbi:MAG: hypothetical protein NTV43_01435 [Methylococcales bacterium]|nr:hypothetical protein [Methylococcales bacterium]
MANKHTTAQVKNTKGDQQLSIQQHETDCPILPVVQLEQLQRFKPEAVDWIINQTQIEAEHRRAQIIIVNRYTFIERIAGQVFAFVIGLSGVLLGSYVALQNQPTAGAAIAGAALAGLAGVFLSGRRAK